MHMSAAGLSIEPALAPAAYDVVHEALEGERCVILDGGTAGGRASASADTRALHRRYVRAGWRRGEQPLGVGGDDVAAGADVAPVQGERVG